MQHDADVYLKQMHELASEAIELAREMDYQSFRAERRNQLSLAYLLQNIGEAARRVEEASKEKHPAIPWPQIIGMRHKIVHDYLGVDFELVWETVKGDLPGLVVQLEHILGKHT